MLVPKMTIKSVDFSVISRRSKQPDQLKESPRNSHSGEGGDPFEEISPEGQALQSVGAADELRRSDLELLAGARAISAQIRRGGSVGCHGQVIPIPPHFSTDQTVPSIRSCRCQAPKSNPVEREYSDSQGRVRR